jgi:putative transcriptional regulator
LPGQGLIHLLAIRYQRDWIFRTGEYTATQIKRIRESNKASQAVFAAYLNTSVSTVQKREHGEKKPNGPSLKLLSLVDAKGLQALVP